MTEPKLAAGDWEEIVSALRLKADYVESGTYDEVAGEVARPGSVTSVWAAHLRRIRAKIEAKVSRE
jgi:hypothetical protein